MMKVLLLIRVVYEEHLQTVKYFEKIVYDAHPWNIHPAKRLLQMVVMQSMKIIGISIWVFVNVTMLGLVVYIYLLWSVYWKMTATPRAPVLETSVQKMPPAYSPWQGRLALAMANGKPRYYWNDTVMLSKLALPTDKLYSKIETYKNQLIVKLRQSQLDAANVLHGTDTNTYNVKYQGSLTGVVGSPDALVCSLRTKVRIKFLDKNTEPFRSLGLGVRFPPDAANQQMWSEVRYNSCAIVASAGSLYKSALGKIIDEHDAVLRFNSAPTEGYESDVGSKTTFRIVNSQVVSKPEFHFLESPLYKNVTLFAWDPSKYKAGLGEWYKHPDFDLFTPYFKHRELYPDVKFYILHPQMIWDAWSYMQQHTSVPIMRHPPSSGLLGIVMMLQLCYQVDVFEYIPSMRLTKRCHYFDIHENMACTFGTWHPLASEKMLTLALNTGSDTDVFVTGFVRIKGGSSRNCEKQNSWL